MYVPNESEVIRNMVERLDENGVVEKDDLPWGVLVVIEANPRQENVP